MFNLNFFLNFFPFVFLPYSFPSSFISLGNTISNWLFLLPTLFGAWLSWKTKLERRYTLTFISLFGEPIKLKFVLKKKNLQGLKYISVQYFLKL